MPDFGRLEQDRLTHTTPVIAPLYAPPPWPLPAARILKVTFETDTAPLLDWIPPRLSRSSPPYAMVTVMHCRKSPVGPFTLATQYAGCRAGMFIRAFSLQAIVDNPVALSGLRELWGVPCKLGEVSFKASAKAASATVSRKGAAIAELGFTEGEQIDAESVRLDPALNVRVFASIQDGRPYEALQIVQVDPDYEISQSLRGKGYLRYPSQSESDPWHLLPVRNIISASYCVADTEMPLARFVMPY